MMAQQEERSTDLAWLAAQEAEVALARIADLDHIAEHAGRDEPSGTWTGGDGERYGLPIGSDADLAQVRGLRGPDRRTPPLADFTWYAPEGLAVTYRLLVEGCLEDGRREVHQGTLENWQHQIMAAWSHAWDANCKFVAGVIEAPARDRGGAGLIVASFEHNSSEHGLARPHVHNLVPMRD